MQEEESELERVKHELETIKKNNAERMMELAKKALQEREKGLQAYISRHVVSFTRKISITAKHITLTLTNASRLCNK
jgi:hypothetical protein